MRLEPPDRLSLPLQAGGGPGRASAFAFLITAIVLSGCIVDTTPGPPSGGLPTKLAATPAPLEPDEQPTTNPSTSQGAPSASPTASSIPSQTSPTAFRVRARVTDATGDGGLQAPDYADLVRIVIESDGRDARVTIDAAATFPDPPASGEVIGIGVDLYKDAEATESDYQLFADGGDDGWFAYLQTPQGFVEYPGSFRLGGGRLVFQVPLASIGGLSAKAADCFLDWSQAGTVVNAAASDRAPNTGRAPIEP